MKLGYASASNMSQTRHKYSDMLVTVPRKNREIWLLYMGYRHWVKILAYHYWLVLIFTRLVKCCFSFVDNKKNLFVAQCFTIFCWLYIYVRKVFCAFYCRMICQCLSIFQEIWYGYWLATFGLIFILDSSKFQLTT